MLIPVPDYISSPGSAISPPPYESQFRPFAFQACCFGPRCRGGTPASISWLEVRDPECFSIPNSSPSSFITRFCNLFATVCSLQGEGIPPFSRVHRRNYFRKFPPAWHPQDWCRNRTMTLSSSGRQQGSSALRRDTHVPCEHAHGVYQSRTWLNEGA
ncbi:hypothetical protein BCR34DRAFT_243919 [Clohesyomyces aquaticus]|uniref:Uncharacterized protein n=1 Tax=Clohesyomyces aquaticus TaxID=1231657 RepID=A0A1Y1ZW54_9PLEO|nr:hypothetical protein BCR34DRAFT_243919 [Clohesyomyces aquaticus]